MCINRKNLTIFHDFFCKKLQFVVVKSENSATLKLAEFFIFLGHVVASKISYFCRSVVAECLGRLCSFDPESLLPKLKESMRSSDPAIRSSAVSAIKYMINDEKRIVDITLQKQIGDFLAAVRDEDLKVRRVALVVLNSAAHNKPALVRDLLPDLLPAVYEETKLRKELIKEVEMGPFKHQVDEGLDLRKCAFEW